ncbi:MAG: Bug family tripartite tricarboxylate transporter substrate binding protein [Hyphomicrobiaceae bacterium]
MPRRILRAIALAGSLLTLLQAPVLAQGAADWPNKPVRLIVNFGPGGTTDNAMRPYAERLGKALGQQFVIENRGGASGALGIEAVIKSAPDGYTFSVTPSLSLVILPHLRKLAFDPLKDLVPVSQFTEGTLVFGVHPSIPAKTVQEVVAYAKANPGKLSWGTAGVGSYGHIVCEAFKLAAGIDILHVPYRGGGESLADFLAGVVQIHADPNTMPHATAGKANLMAVFDRARRPDFPNVPLMHEIYPEMDYILWFGVAAPVGTPPDIVQKFAKELAKISADPELKAQLFKVAATPNPNATPEDMAKLMQKDFDRFGALIRKLNIKAE